MIFKGSFDSVIGKIVVEDDGEFVTKVYIDNDFSDKENNENSRLFCLVKKQLEEYFDGERKEFHIPVKMQGTDFQKTVWNALCRIPYGKTMSYKDVAVMIGKPGASRAVGSANHKNPIMIIVPCHRVIGTKGNLIGYAYGTDMKQMLLNLEKNTI